MSLQHTLNDCQSQHIPEITSQRNTGMTMNPEKHKYCNNCVLEERQKIIEIGLCDVGLTV